MPRAVHGHLLSLRSGHVRVASGGDDLLPALRRGPTVTAYHLHQDAMRRQSRERYWSNRDEILSRRRLRYRLMHQLRHAGLNVEGTESLAELQEALAHRPT